MSNEYAENMTNINLDERMIYSLYVFIKNIFIVFGVFTGSACISFIVVGFAMSNKIKKKAVRVIKDEYNFDYDSNSESDYSESESDFISKYLNEYEKLELRELDTKILDSFKTIYIEDKTPKGLIKMTYDNVNNSFNYFSDSKDIPYSYLETMGRLFVIKNNCKSIFINHQKKCDENISQGEGADEEGEYEGEDEGREKEGEEGREKEGEDEGREKEGEGEGKETENNVFATFKRYNYEKQLEKISEKVLDKELIFNRYIYKGKLRDYDDLIKDLNLKKLVSDEFEHIDYNTFKKLSNLEKKTV